MGGAVGRGRAGLLLHVRGRRRRQRHAAEEGDGRAEHRSVVSPVRLGPCFRVWPAAWSVSSDLADSRPEAPDLVSISLALLRRCEAPHQRLQLVLLVL